MWKSCFFLDRSMLFVHRQVCRKRMLSTCSFVKLLFHSFPQGSRVDSTGWCGQKLKLTVDVRRNVADVVGERSGACGKLLLDLFERVNDGRMVTAEFLADVGQA